MDQVIDVSVACACQRIKHLTIWYGVHSARPTMISLWVSAKTLQQRKTVANPPRIDKVIAMVRVARFWLTVYVSLFHDMKRYEAMQMVRFVPNKPNYSLYQKRSVALKYAEMRWGPGLCPGPRWGSLRRFPRPPSQLGRTPPPHVLPLWSPMAPRSSRLRRSFGPYHFWKRSGAHAYRALPTP